MPFKSKHKSQSQWLFALVRWGLEGIYVKTNVLFIALKPQKRKVTSCGRTGLAHPLMMSPATSYAWYLLEGAHAVFEWNTDCGEQAIRSQPLADALFGSSLPETMLPARSEPPGHVYFCGFGIFANYCHPHRSVAANLGCLFGNVPTSAMCWPLPQISSLNQYLFSFIRRTACYDKQR